MKTFCAVRNAAKRMKGQAVHWEKIGANYITDKKALYPD